MKDNDTIALEIARRYISDPQQLAKLQVDIIAALKQVGEVQGEDEMRAEWRAAGGGIHGPNVETVTMPEADYFRFRASIAAHQPKAQAPLGWWLVDENGIGRLSYTSQREFIEVYRNTPGYSATPLYAAPPVQGIDLGQLRSLLVRINEDEDGDNYHNLSCDALDLIDGAKP